MPLSTKTQRDLLETEKQKEAELHVKHVRLLLTAMALILAVVILGHVLYFCLLQ